MDRWRQHRDLCHFIGARERGAQNPKPRRHAQARLTSGSQGHWTAKPIARPGVGRNAAGGPQGPGVGESSSHLALEPGNGCCPKMRLPDKRCRSRAVKPFLPSLHQPPPASFPSTPPTSSTETKHLLLDTQRAACSSASAVLFILLEPRRQTAGHRRPKGPVYCHRPPEPSSASLTALLPPNSTLRLPTLARPRTAPRGCF